MAGAMVSLMESFSRGILMQIAMRSPGPGGGSPYPRGDGPTAGDHRHNRFEVVVSHNIPSASPSLLRSPMAGALIPLRLSHSL